MAAPLVIGVEQPVGTMPWVSYPIPSASLRVGLGNLLQ